MPNPNKTEIVFVLDASDSMRTSGMAPEAASGLNAFIKKQAAEPGECTVTVIQFNSTLRYHVVVQRVSADDAPEIAVGVNYHPGGMTPMRECVCVAIDRLGEALSELAEEDRPGKVIFVILTDGKENDSAAQYTWGAMNQRVTHQRDVYSWQFVFLGANICSEEEAGKAGIAKGTTADFGDIRAAVQLTSSKIAMYRSTGQAEALNYSAEERAAMAGDTPPKPIREIRPSRCATGRCGIDKANVFGGAEVTEQVIGRLRRGDVDPFLSEPLLDPTEITVTSTADVEKDDAEKDGS